MNRSLLRLHLLLTKAAIRRMIRAAKTLRGAFLLIFSLGLTVLGLAPSFMLAFSSTDQHELIASRVEPFLPAVLLALWLLLMLTSAGEFSVLFTPPEIDFLFPAPFHRRELLIYKLGKTAVGLAVMSLFLLIYFMPGLRSWAWGYLGVFLTLVFMNLAGMVLTLAGQIVSAHTFSKTRKAVAAVVLILAGAALAQTIGGGLAERNPLELATAFRESFAGRVLLAPFEVFSRTICSGGIRDGVLVWGTLALAMNAALLMLVFRLDADYLESASTISGKIYERAMRSKQGGGIAIAASSASVRIRPRRFPWLGGIGPVAWRQVVLALRRSKLPILMTAMLSTIFFVMAKVQSKSAGVGDGMPLTLALIGGLCYLTFLLSMQSPWAFRGDLDHIEGLKTLPIRPTALVLGELSGGVSILTIIQAAILAASLVILPVKAGIILTALAFTAPLNAVFLGVNNLLFLVYPFRAATGTTMDVQQVGRALIFTMLQGLILIPTLGLPMGVGGIAFLAGSPFWLCGLLAWSTLMVELPPILWLTGRAFDQFDPGTQTPA